MLYQSFFLNMKLPYVTAFCFRYLLLQASQAEVTTRVDCGSPLPSNEKLILHIFLCILLCLSKNSLMLPISVCPITCVP